MARVKSKNTVYYVDPKKMLAEYIKYKEHRDQNIAENKSPPRIPEYLGSCILKICKGLGEKSNFANYPFITEMISDAIENCLQYFDKFDPTHIAKRSGKVNIFAYYSQIAYFAFLRRIAEEKTELYKRHKVLANSLMLDELVNQNENDDVALEVRSQLTTDFMNNFVKDFEEQMADKQKKGQEKNASRKKPEGDGYSTLCTGAYIELD